MIHGVHFLPMAVCIIAKGTDDDPRGTRAKVQNAIPLRLWQGHAEIVGDDMQQHAADERGDPWAGNLEGILRNPAGQKHPYHTCHRKAHRAPDGRVASAQRVEREHHQCYNGYCMSRHGRDDSAAARPGVHLQSKRPQAHPIANAMQKKTEIARLECQLVTSPRIVRDRV
jgi:hypothetical protein